MDPKPGYQLDLQQLEVEHRQIHRRIERLQAALADGSAADVRAGLQFLERYLVEHFAHEEAPDAVNAQFGRFLEGVYGA